MTTSLVLVAIFGWELLDFDDETRSRHRFEVKKALFWRRESISSPFTVKNARFWRRDPFSSPFLGGNYSILTTRPFLVTVLK
ncbi:hypothetical protein [Caldibacillus thermoamylovorans]|uniref:hypothetical protein n=1 Tax=Caldibacillus thermoamylovorans TaxID=35841 RepID=UPI0022E7150E|nr:hypothetical protein [Caldibacillus thermoamylovorans]